MRRKEPPTADPYTDTAVIDSRAPRTNQAVVGLVSLLAVVTGWWWLLALLALQLAVGLIFGRRYCLPCVAVLRARSSRASARARSRTPGRRGPRTSSVSSSSASRASPTRPASAAPARCSALLVAALALLAALTGFCTGCEAYKLACLFRGRPFVSCPLPPGRDPLTWQFVLAGGAVGVLVGMTGMGGGSLMTPMLILIFGFDPKTAVGTDIVHGAIFKSFGAVRHRQLGNVDTRLALWMLVGSGPLSLVGVQIASSFSDSTAVGRWAKIDRRLADRGRARLLRQDVHPAAPEPDGQFALTRAREGDRDPDRRDLRIRRRPDVGRLGHVLRACAPPALPALGDTRGRHRPPPRGAPALDRRRRPPAPRQRRPARDRLAPDRVDPRRARRLAPLDPRAGARVAGRVRVRARPLGDQARRDSRTRRRSSRSASGWPRLALVAWLVAQIRRRRFERRVPASDPA